MSTSRPLKGRAIDAAVAEAMGLPQRHYSTDLAAAWEVAEWLMAKYSGAMTLERRPDKQPQWVASFYWNHLNLSPTGYGDTPPEAICRAALAVR